MVKIAIIGYVGMLGFFYSCDILGGCLSNPAFWPYYYIWDHLFGGGVALWFIAYLYSNKYRVPAFFVFIFSFIRFFWQTTCYITGVNPSDTYWTLILFFCLLPVIFITVFTPKGRLTGMLNRTLNLTEDKLSDWQRRITTYKRK